MGLCQAARAAEAGVPGRAFAAVRPAYGAECQGLGFSIVVMSERLAGFAGGLMVLGLDALVCWLRGAMARLLPYVACKRVVSRQPSSGLW